MRAEAEGWAVRAHDEFVAGLSADAASAARERREVMVAVYGPTQVGKTTLVLTLLDVAQGSAFREVEQVLRGGSARGRSATAVPMRYARSEDDSWRIGTADAPALDAESATAALAELRAAVVAGQHVGTDPLKLFIPNRLFAKGDPPVRVSLLDLPGIHAAAPHERALVSRIAERHVPAATLVLLVSNADNLGVFNPRTLKEGLDELSDWMDGPDRYRLVTTRSYSPQSVRRERERAKAEGRGLTVEDVRARLVGQLARFPEIGALETLQQLRIYPLEFGDSWEGLRREQPEHHAWAEVVQRDVRAELAADIDESCRGDRRLGIGRDVARQARRRRSALVRECRDVMQGFAQVRASLMVKRDVARREHGRCENKLRAAQDALAAREVALKSLEIFVDDRLRQVELVGKPDTKLTALNDWLEDILGGLHHALKGIAVHYRRNHQLSIDDISSPDCVEMNAFRERLAGYNQFFDEYYPILSNNFENDLASAHVAVAAYREACAAEAKRKLRMQLSRAIRNARVEYNRVQRQQRYIEQQQAEIEQELRILGESRTAERRALLRRFGVARLDNREADMFDARMLKARDQELRRVEKEVRAAARAKASAQVLARMCQLELTRRFHQDRCLSTSA